MSFFLSLSLWAKVVQTWKGAIVVLLLFFYLRAERGCIVVGVRLIETLDFAIVRKNKNLHIPIVPGTYIVYIIDTGSIDRPRKKESNTKEGIIIFQVKNSDCPCPFHYFHTFISSGFCIWRWRQQQKQQQPTANTQWKRAHKNALEHRGRPHKNGINT